MRLVLGRDCDAPYARVQRVRKRKVDDARLATEIDGRLGASVGADESIPRRKSAHGDGHSAELLRARGQEYGAVTGRPRRCGWLDIPLLRYSHMINSTQWLVVTKMDVMDECPEIPVCTSYKIDGKVTDVIPADVVGFKKIEPVYTTMPGWMCSTEGITEYDKLPKKAQEYLIFIEQQSGARIGMISTGPDRVQTINTSGFDDLLG